MKKNYVLIFAVILLCSAIAFGQKSGLAAKAVADDAAYNELVAKIKGGDTSIDFKALRIAFTHTKNYSPYGGDRDGQKILFAAIDKKNYKDAVKKAEELLKDDYVDMDAHVGASLAYRGLGENDKADIHKNIYLGLVNSIIKSGDGKTASTAYVVISTHEEYITLRALGLASGDQSLQHLDGHTFDVLTATDPKTKESLKVFFNIDISWKAETEIFK